MGEENPGSNSHEPLASAAVWWMGEAGIAASSRAEPGTGADALQRPLGPRFRCRARLTAGVGRQDRATYAFDLRSHRSRSLAPNHGPACLCRNAVGQLPLQRHLAPSLGADPSERTAMDVFEAVNSRIACRWFLDKPVDHTIVRQLLEGAARAASSGNLQPWNVYAVTGEPLKEITRQAAAALEKQDWRTMETEYPALPQPLWEPYLSRSVRHGRELYGALGTAREDRVGRNEQIKRNYQFFNGLRSPRRPLAAAQPHPTTCLLACHDIAISNEDLCQVF